MNMSEQFSGSIAFRGKKRPADDVFGQAQKRICPSKLSGRNGNAIAIRNFMLANGTQKHPRRKTFQRAMKKVTPSSLSPRLL